MICGSSTVRPGWWDILNKFSSPSARAYVGFSSVPEMGYGPSRARGLSSDISTSVRAATQQMHCDARWTKALERGMDRSLQDLRVFSVSENNKRIQGKQSIQRWEFVTKGPEAFAHRFKMGSRLSRRRATPGS